jgi:hypothetical protein
MISPQVLSARLTVEQLQATSEAATARGQTVSEYTRDALRTACISLMASDAGTPEYRLTAIAELLDLPKDSSVEAIVQAVKELASPAPLDPLAIPADAPVQLSGAALVIAKAKAVRRVGAERPAVKTGSAAPATVATLSAADLHAIKQSGLTQDEFVERKNELARSMRRGSK